MPVSPMYVNGLAPTWTPVVSVDGGGPLNLTGVDIASFTLTIRNTKTLTDQAGAGTFAYVNQAGGQIAYQWKAPDSAVAGTYLLLVSFTSINGGRQDCDAIAWTVRNR